MHQVQCQLTIQLIIAGFDGNTVCANDVLILKGVCSVQLQSSGNFCDLGSIRCLHIDVIDGTGLGRIVAVIAADQINLALAGAGFYGQVLGQASLIALLIENDKGNRMLAIGQGHIAQAQKAVCSLEAVMTGHIDTVDQDLGSAVVQTGHIVGRDLCNIGLEGQGAVVHGLTIQNHIIGTVGADHCVGNHGSIAVIGGITVIQGDVIDVEDQILGIIDCTTGDEAGHGRIAAMIGCIRMIIGTKGLNHIVRLIGQVHIDIQPAGLRNRIVGRVLHLHGLALDV